MASKPTGSNRSTAGFTLVEMLVSVALCMLLLAALASLYTFSLGSFASIASYSELNQKTRHASDIISRDVRSALFVDPSTTGSKLVLGMPSGSTVSYVYDPVGATLVRSTPGESLNLLTGIGSLSFALYQRPTSGSLPYEVLPLATAGSAKLVAFKWNCSERIVGSRADSQILEAGMVELRNQ
jgi:Tfp pilus assembly protein PilW